MPAEWSGIQKSEGIGEGGEGDERRGGTNGLGQGRALASCGTDQAEREAESQRAKERADGRGKKKVRDMAMDMDMDMDFRMQSWMVVLEVGGSEKTVPLRPLAKAANRFVKIQPEVPG